MRSTMDARGIQRDDIGLSLIVQGYAFRIASVAIGVWLVSGGVPDVSPENVSIQFGRNRPNAVLLEHATWIAPPTQMPADTLPMLHQHFIDDHMAVIIDTSRQSSRVGARMMWSNVATSCASSFGALMDPLPDERAAIRRRAEEFLAGARPELAAGGEIVPIGPKWAWQRNACCLYYLDPNGSKCGDCSLHSVAERTERYAALLAEVQS
jgi:ferric iron reductase protein FhuF